MLRTIAFVCLLALPAVHATSAQSLYKCQYQGKTSYQDKPCVNGSSTTLTMAPLPAPDPAAGGALAQERRLADQLTAARHARERAQEKLDAKAQAKAAQRAPRPPARARSGARQGSARSATQTAKLAPNAPVSK
ncbi:MAG: hypothetical protein V4582_16025 [Pseudomonadota bacterium]